MVNHFIEIQIPITLQSGLRMEQRLEDYSKQEEISKFLTMITCQLFTTVNSNSVTTKRFKKKTQQ
jgi:hypothetical protein